MPLMHNSVTLVAPWKCGARFNYFSPHSHSRRGAASFHRMSPAASRSGATIGIRQARNSSRAGTFATKSELGLLIDRAPDRWRPYLVTAIFTGLRASELRGLRWCDVDLNAGEIHVTQRADLWGHIGSPKSAAGTRDIPGTPLVLNTLRQWRSACPMGELGLVFPNGAGQGRDTYKYHQRVWTRCR